MLIKNGNIVGKWNRINIPSQNELTKTIEQFIADNNSNTSNAMKVVFVSLLLLIPLGVMKIVDFKKH